MAPKPRIFHIELTTGFHYTLVEGLLIEASVKDSGKSATNTGHARVPPSREPHL